MPPNKAKAGNYVLSDELGIDEKRAREIMHYAYCHKNLHFGWDFVKHLVNTPGATFPAFLHGQDLFLWRAYKFLQGYYDPVIAGAISYTSSGYSKLRRDLNSMLVSPQTEEYQVTLDKDKQKKELPLCPEMGKTISSVYLDVAANFGLPLGNVIAYEKLFYNVVDRRADHAFIANIVYPEGRWVEAMADYMEKVTAEEFTMRAAYNNRPEVALYLMGIVNVHPFVNYDETSGSKELDKRFMQDGILYAAAGLQNSENCMPIKNARLSIQAGKMGNGEQQNAGTTTTLADAMRDAAIHVSELKARAQVNAQLMDTYDIPANVTLELPQKP